MPLWFAVGVFPTHNGKPAVAKKDRHGSDRHVAMNTNRGNGGHFRR